MESGKALYKGNYPQGHLSSSHAVAAISIDRSYVASCSRLSCLHLCLAHFFNVRVCDLKTTYTPSTVKLKLQTTCPFRFMCKLYTVNIRIYKVQTASLSVQQLLQGLRSWLAHTDRQTERHMYSALKAHMMPLYRVKNFVNFSRAGFKRGEGVRAPGLPPTGGLPPNPSYFFSFVICVCVTIGFYSLPLSDSKWVNKIKQNQEWQTGGFRMLPDQHENQDQCQGINLQN